MTREPSCSRFRIAPSLAGAALCASLLLAGCSSYYGHGITELAAERGWQPLPIEAWVLNDGLSAKAMSFCPRATCARQGFAALITLEGREADAAERTLAADPARLAREFARPAQKDKAAAAKPEKPGPPKSLTAVSRYSEDGVAGLLVEIRARDEGGKRAVTAILSGREAGRLIVALGVSPDPDAARLQARAAWNDK